MTTPAATSNNGQEGQVILEARDLKKHFPVTRGIILARVTGYIKAVDGVSFQIRAGETLGIVGESGCGKTTTAKMVLMLEQPTEGNIYYQGEDIYQANEAGRKEYRSSVQAVFQDPWSSLNPRMRVKDLIAEPMVINWQLTKSENRERVLKLLRDLQQEFNMAMIFITHDFGIVAKMCDRVAVMYAGKIVEMGSVRDIFNNPSHPYTEALLASVPRMDEDVDRLYAIEGQPPLLHDLPVGCSFADRCPYVMDRCREEYPPEFPVAEGHYSACWRLE